MPATPGTTACPPSLPSVPTSRATRVTSAREAAELIDHRVDGFFELENFAAHVDGDLLGQVAVGDRDRHVGDVAHLRGQVAGHLVDRFGELLPDAGDAFDLRLAAQLAFGADFARDARDFGGEDRELVDHAVDEFGGTQEFAFQRSPVDFQRHGLPQIAFGHGADSAVTSVVGQTRSSISVLMAATSSAHPPATPGDAHPLFELALFADDVK